MNNDKSAPREVSLSKEDLSKIVEDPYFQYLIKEKARAQTKSYLILVSSIILGVLAYGGWEFKSVRDLLEKERATVSNLSEKVRNTADDVTAKAAIVAAKKDEMSQTIDAVKSTIDGARAFTDQSNLATGSLLAAARENIQDSQNSQRRFYEQQNSLLNTFSSIHSSVSDAANRQLEMAGDKLREVKTLTEETRRRADESAAEINQVLQKAAVVQRQGGTLTELTDGALRLQGIQKKLLQGGIVGTVFLRAQQLQTIKMLDPYDPLKKDSEWYITFKRFHLNSETLHIIGEAKQGEYGTPIQFELPNISARPSQSEHPSHSLLRWKIPFKLQLNFAYHTKLSRDFVSLKLYGEETEEKPKVAAK